MSIPIPAIDIIEGKCVRLTQGAFDSKKEYNLEPLELAQAIEGAGLPQLHLVDLDGARGGRVMNYKVLERIASKTSLKIDFGGGIKSDEDIHIAFESGAAQVTAGSIAVKNRTLFESWLARYGGEKLILGADARDERIAVSGWEEETDLWIYDFLQDYVSRGIKYAICTDISKDGMLEGPSFSLYADIRKKLPDLKVVASGGVSSVEDLEKLSELKLHGSIVGKAFLEGKISLDDMSRLYEESK